MVVNTLRRNFVGVANRKILFEIINFDPSLVGKILDLVVSVNLTKVGLFEDNTLIHNLEKINRSRVFWSLFERFRFLGKI